MATFEAWILCGVGCETGDEPWASIHPTHADAMKSLRDAWDWYIREHYTDDQHISEDQLRDALDGVIQFSIDTTILDTEDFGL